VARLPSATMNDGLRAARQRVFHRLRNRLIMPAGLSLTGARTCIDTLRG
jgi:hypothetical protein